MTAANAVVVDLKFERREVDRAVGEAFPDRAILHASDRDCDL